MRKEQKKKVIPKKNSKRVFLKLMCIDSVSKCKPTGGRECMYCGG